MGWLEVIRGVRTLRSKLVQYLNDWAFNRCDDSSIGKENVVRHPVSKETPRSLPPLPIVSTKSFTYLVRIVITL